MQQWLLCLLLRSCLVGFMHRCEVRDYLAFLFVGMTFWEVAALQMLLAFRSAIIAEQPSRTCQIA